LLTASSNTLNSPAPKVWEGQPIPEVLTSGDHGKVEAWRRDEARRITRERRPDLWTAYLAGHDSRKKTPPEG
jgi:tRNA (guanine37-N1)-methyltransferase